MVHALQQTHRMLQPNGILVSAQFLPAPNVIEVYSAETTRIAGWLLDREDFMDERAAFNALAQVVADRDFMLEDEQAIDHNIYVDSLSEFQVWLGEWWESSILPETTLQRLEELMLAADPSAQIRVAIKARMTKLKVTG